MSATHTHVETEFANPWLRCDVCSQPVEGMVSFEGQVGGCTHKGLNTPCGHLGATSICPSWGPVDGCQCQEHLGYVPHPGDGRADPTTDRSDNG